RIRALGGLPDDVDIYSLRHNFASQLIRAGTDLFTVSKLMAHSDIQTTIENYAHLAPDHAAEAVARLPGAEL
ncbi:tyrosine-type recombinase/integrase, partial [Klebsiella pneumoniae]|uniref:tyrosine-type recombinase/integrase n=1 Tax=Klebsiella pneumoniae TaxID=573 RepID=UPI00272F822C